MFQMGTFSATFSDTIWSMGRNIIGNRVRLARKNAKPPITQADLAARLQIKGLRVDRAAISKIETGYREVSDIEAAAISEALGVSISWFFSESGKG